MDLSFAQHGFSVDSVSFQLKMDVLTLAVLPKMSFVVMVFTIVSGVSANAGCCFEFKKMYYLVITNRVGGNKNKLMGDESKLLLIVYVYYITQTEGSGPRKCRRLPAPLNYVLYTAVVGLFQVLTRFSTLIDETIFYLFNQTNIYVI